jgi:hypothetical protein
MSSRYPNGYRIHHLLDRRRSSSPRATPEVSGLADKALTSRINAAIYAPVTPTVDEFVKRFTDHAGRVNVYDLRWRYADTSSRAVETTAVTVRIDTGAAVPVQNLLSAQGREDAGSPGSPPDLRHSGASPTTTTGTAVGTASDPSPRPDTAGLARTP